MTVQSADVVIVGGGIIGLSTAYHLALKQPGLHVVVLEREPLTGTGATSKATGGIRHQFGTEVNVRLTQLSYPAFTRFQEEHDQPIGFRAHGYLFLAGSDETWRTLQANVALQRGLGVPVELVRPEEARRLVPHLRIDDLRGGAFCALDGSANPTDAAQGYLRSARRLGVQVVCDATVTQLDVVGGRVTGVRAGDARYADVVVDAAGPCVAQIAELAGVSIPARPFRRQVFVLTPDPELPRGLPFTVDLETGWYLHQEQSGQLLFGGTDKDNRPGTEEVVDWDGFDAVASAAMARVPAIAERAQVLRAYAGVRTLTPDHHAIIGPIPGVDGLVVATACNGHGFMHAPVVGTLLAEQIVDGRPTSLDISPLAADRFGQGDLPDESLTF